MELIKADILQALILTKDEEPNLERVLDRLQWLKSVVVLDSFSTDRTLEIVRSFPNTLLLQREFDTHATQWNYGLSQLTSKWVLSLDADYILTESFAQEVRRNILQVDKAAFYADFKFLVFGEALIRDNTTPRPVLFLRSRCAFYDDGHTQRLNIDGSTGKFEKPILHDDRKSLTRWIANQSDYSAKECEKLLRMDRDALSMTSRIRRNQVCAPIFVFFYCLFIQGVIFNGWRGWHYTLQRTLVEMLLALRLIEETNFKKRI